MADVDNSGTCSICKNWYRNFTFHKCEPEFEVQELEMDKDEWYSFRGETHGLAAEKYVENRNYEGELINEEITLRVRKKGHEKIIKIIVKQEIRIHYHSVIAEGQEQ